MNVYNQIKQCLNLPFSANSFKDNINIRVDIDKNGFVRSTKVVDVNKYRSDKFYRAYFDRLRVAFLDSDCQPFVMSEIKREQFDPEQEKVKKKTEEVARKKGLKEEKERKKKLAEEKARKKKLVEQ